MSSAKCETCGHLHSEHLLNGECSVTSCISRCKCIQFRRAASQPAQAGLPMDAGWQGPYTVGPQCSVLNGNDEKIATVNHPAAAEALCQLLNRTQPVQAGAVELNCNHCSSWRIVPAEVIDAAKRLYGCSQQQVSKDIRDVDALVDYIFLISQTLPPATTQKG